MSLTTKISNLLARRKSDPLRSVPFAQLAHEWRRRCASWDSEIGARTRGRRAAVLVTPWLGTPVPFYNLEVAQMLAAAGDDVEIIFDACNVMGNVPVQAEADELAATLGALPRDLPIFRVDETQAVEPESGDEELAQRIIAENGVWRTRGESGAGQFVDRKRDSLARLSAHVARVRKLIASRGYEWLFVPGGIWGLSGVYVAAASRAGIRFTTFDSGNRILFVCQDGLAAHQSDLLRAFAMASEKLTSADRTRIVAWSRHELDERMNGRGNYTTFQSRPATGHAAGDANVFVPLNLRWDSAALGRQRLFASVQEWITAIVRWTATEPQARVCIRQHPVERHAAYRSSDDLGALVRAINTAGDRVRFIAADDPVNSYDLLGSVRALLPFTSSMGAEAPMLGIPVITSAHNYYDTFDFVHRAESPEHYFALITRAIHGALPVSEQARENAALIYFLVQHCNLMPTGFTATPADFLEWVKVPPAELWAQPELQDLRRALLSGEPLSFIRQQRFLASE